MNWTMLAILALAAARATHLTADDLLPFGYIRDRLEGSESEFLQTLAVGMNCTFCTSIYSGAAAAGLAQWQGWAPDGFWVFMLLWFGFAEVVVLLEGLVFRLMGE